MNDHIKILLVKYITLQASEEEIIAAEAFIDESLENEATYIELYEAYHFHNYQQTTERGWQNAFHIFTQKTGSAQGNYLWALLLAASILLFGSWGFFVFNRINREPNTPQLLETHVRPGKKLKLDFPDGTVVWLNSESYLKYPDNFGHTSRTVYLDGEACFVVGKKLTKFPFIVKTKHFSVRDIGTTFTINSFSGDNSFSAAVLVGEIAVEPNDKGVSKSDRVIHLKKHNVLKITPKPAVSEAASFDEADVEQITQKQEIIYTGWKDDDLSFDDNTFREIATVLEKRFDIKIEFKDKDIQEYKYSGSFKSIQNIEKILYVISRNTPIGYTVKAQKVFIYKTN